METLLKTRNSGTGTIQTMNTNTILKSGLLDQNTINTIINGREDIKNIISGEDNRIIIIGGPCSVTKKGILDFTEKITPIIEEISDKILFVLRFYVEKPRTELKENSWEGFIHSPTPNSKWNSRQEGIIETRKLAKEIIEKYKLPLATEILDYVTYYYFLKDYFSYGAIGSRSTLNQSHRKIASLDDISIGLKNSMDGNLNSIIQGINSAQSPQQLELGIDYLYTNGNPNAHGILRGGNNGANYKINDLKKIIQLMEEKIETNKTIIVDTNHSNSQKHPELQPEIAIEILNSINKLESEGIHAKQIIKGFMIEMDNGFSYTDKGIDVETSIDLLKEIYSKL